MFNEAINDYRGGWRVVFAFFEPHVETLGCQSSFEALSSSIGIEPSRFCWGCSSGLTARESPGLRHVREHGPFFRRAGPVGH
jgi:hypothetical protein